MKRREKRAKRTAALTASLFLFLLIAVAAVQGLVPAALADPGDYGNPIVYDGTNNEDFPVYPAPGGVSLGKTSTGWLDEDNTTAAVTLSVSGQPMPQGVDIVLVVDTSQSMSTAVTVPTNSNIVSGIVRLEKQVTYATATGSTAPAASSSSWSTQNNATVWVQFTAYVDKTTGAMVAAGSFSGSIPGLSSSTSTVNHLRYVSTASGTVYNLGSGSGRATSTGAKNFYQAIFAGTVFMVDGVQVTMPSAPATSFSSLPATVPSSTLPANDAVDLSFTVSASYGTAGNSAFTSNIVNYTNETITVSFRAYVERSTGKILAVYNFTATLPLPASNARYLRFPNGDGGRIFDLGAATGTGRATSAGAKEFYAALFAGVTGGAIGGSDVIMPTNLSTLPASVTTTISTTRLAQMKIAANAFLDEMYAPTTYIDAELNTVIVPSPHRVSLVDFGNNDARLYRSGAFFNYSESTAMKTYIDALTTTAGTNYVSALNTAAEIVTGIVSDPDYDGHPVYVVFMSDGEPRGGTGAGNPVVYSTTTTGTGDAANINNARASLHTALGGASSDNGVFTVGYMIDGIEYAREWLDSIALAPGTFTPAKGVTDITGVFEDIARTAKKAGTNAVVRDVMGKESNPIVLDAEGNPTGEHAEFYVDMDVPFTLRSGADTVILGKSDFTNDGGMYTAGYSLGSRAGTVEVDTTVNPNVITWDFGDILEDDISLTYGVIVITESGEVPNGIYYTNTEADLTYQNYLGNYVSREFPIPQLTRPGNSIRVIYFAANANGNAISGSGTQLPYDGPSVNTIKNILSTDAIILFDGYLDVNENIIKPTAADDITLYERTWTVNAADPTYLKDGVTYSRVVAPEAYLVYDIGAGTYTQKTNPCEIDLPDASNGFIVLVGYSPKLTLTVTDQYGSADPVTRFSEERGAGTTVAENKLSPAGFTYTGVTITVTDISGNIITDTTKYDVGEDPAGSGAVGGTMPYGNVTIAYRYDPVTINITVTKLWRDNNNAYFTRRDSVGSFIAGGEVTLRRYDGASDATGTVLGAIGQQLNGTDSQQMTFNVPTHSVPDPEGNQTEYRYVAAETTVPTGYAASYSSDGLTVTNTLSPGTVTITGTKSWYDNENRNNTRPVSIYVQLKRGNTVIETKLVSAPWTYEFEAPMYDSSTQERIVYTVDETEVLSGGLQAYTKAIDGYNIANTLNPGTVVIRGTKTWNDNTNGNNTRPGSIIVLLMRGDTEIDRQTVTAPWTYEFEAPMYDELTQELIEYRVDEEEAGAGDLEAYSKSVTGYNITNALNPGTVTITGIKSWYDNDNGNSTRPTNIIVKLMRGDTEIERLTVTAPWTYEFNAPKYDELTQELIVYRVDEEAAGEGDLDAYAKTVTGYNIANTLEPGTVTISGIKSWYDDENGDNTRPASIIVQLKRGDTVVESRTVSAPWTYSFTVPKYDAGTQELIVYTVDEAEAVPGDLAAYNKTVVGFNISNTLEPGSVTISGAKTWRDNGNLYKTRPVSIIVQLKRGESVVESQTVSDPWTYTFTAPMYDANTQELIVYTIEEVEVYEDDLAAYTKTINGYNITNTLNPGTVTITGIKSWYDDENGDETRPESIYVQLKRGNAVVQTQEVRAPWTYSFTAPMYDSLTQELIVYTVDEAEVTSGDLSAYTKAIDGYNIANTLNPGTVTITGTKSWRDNTNGNNTRPGSIYVLLMRGETEIARKIVTAPWTYSFEAPMYDELTQELIIYTVDEAEVNEGDLSEYSKVVTGYSITNTLNPGTVKITGTKSWYDNENAYGTRPGSIIVILMRGDTEIARQTVTAPWNYEFEAPMYDAQTQALIVYTVDEAEVSEGDLSEYTKAVDGYDIANTLNPGSVTITGTKTWYDNENAYETRPGSIIVLLMRGETEIARKTVTAPWNYEFEAPMYDAQTQALIVYTVDEAEVSEGDLSEYTKAVDGYDITNTLKPGSVIISGTKTWYDNENGNNTRPGNIIVQLKRDGAVVDTRTVSAPWTYSFTVPMYDAQTQVRIEYTVDEAEVMPGDLAEYSKTINGYNIINRLSPGSVTITGTKTWYDGGNVYGARPESIVVQLKRGDTVVESLTVSSPWTYSFTVPMYDAESQALITYTVDEVEAEPGDLAEYIKTVSGYNITNTLLTSVSAVKVWDDDGNISGERPSGITIVLKQDGETIREQPLSGTGDTWQYEFTGLLFTDVNGDRYEYTIDEITDEQTSRVYEKDIDGYTITNTRVPGAMEGTLTVYKVLFDRNGVIIDESMIEEYAQYRDYFNIRLEDATDPAKGTVITERSVQNGGAVTFTVNDVRSASQLILSETGYDTEIFEAAEIYGIHWEGGNGVATVFNRVKGDPTVTEPGEIQVEKYIVYHGRLLLDPEVAQEFRVTVTPQAETAFGTIIIDVPEILEGIESYDFDYDDAGTVDRKIAAVLSYDGIQLYEWVEDEAEIVFAGLRLDTPFDLKIMLRDLELEEDVTLFETTVEFTDFLTYLVGFEALEAEETPEPETETEDIDDPDEPGVPWEPGETTGTATATSLILEDRTIIMPSTPEFIEYLRSGLAQSAGYTDEYDPADTDPPEEEEDDKDEPPELKITANDPEGLLVTGLEPGAYLVKETGIPVDFTFYGMKLGDTNLTMTDINRVNGLIVETNEEAGSVVIIFNEYNPVERYTLTVNYYINGVLHSTTVELNKLATDSYKVEASATLTVNGVTYNFSRDSGNLEGTFDNGNVVVDLYYVSPGTNPGGNPRPRPEPNPVTPVTPIVDTPTIIPETEVPLAELPEPEPEEQQEEEEIIVIAPDEVPLGELPQTGTFPIYLPLALFGLLAIGVGLVIRPVRKNGWQDW